jgi:hypothetical protein
MNEQYRNLIENKGPLWKAWRRSGNVVENKGSYASKAGILLKRKGLGAGDLGLDQPTRFQSEIPPLRSALGGNDKVRPAGAGLSSIRKGREEV